MCVCCCILNAGEHQQTNLRLFGCIEIDHMRDSVNATLSFCSVDFDRFGSQIHTQLSTHNHQMQLKTHVFYLKWKCWRQSRWWCDLKFFVFLYFCFEFVDKECVLSVLPFSYMRAKRIFFLEFHSFICKHRKKKRIKTYLSSTSFKHLFMSARTYAIKKKKKNETKQNKTNNNKNRRRRRRTKIIIIMRKTKLKLPKNKIK